MSNPLPYMFCRIWISFPSFLVVVLILRFFFILTSFQLYQLIQSSRPSTQPWRANVFVPRAQHCSSQVRALWSVLIHLSFFFDVYMSISVNIILLMQGHSDVSITISIPKLISKHRHQSKCILLFFGPNCFFPPDLISRLYYQDLAAQNIQTSEIFRKKRNV